MSSAQAANWDIKENSTLRIEFKQFGVPTRGNFEQFTPKIEFDRGNPESCKIDVKIDLASIASGSSQRDKIIKSDDFFKIDTYPHATFSSEKCKNIGGNAYEAYGELTIRNITRPVMLPFTLDYQTSGSVLTANAKAELPLSRYDYDLGNTGMWRGTGIISRVIRIYLDIEASVQDN